MVRTTISGIAIALCVGLCGAARAQSVAPPGAEPVPADRSLLAAELAQLERERAEVGLGGPIAMLVGGGVVFALGATILLATVLSDAYCSADDGFDDRCAGPDDAFYVIGGVAMVGGGALALFGLIELLDRAAVRRRLGVRIKELRRLLEPAPAYGFYLDAGAGRAVAVVRLQF